MPTKPSPPPQKKQTRARSTKQREERRRVLLEAALHCFNERGYAETSVAMITKRAELSTGTFYLYFQSKVEVFSYLYNEAIDMLKPRFAKAAQSTGGTYQKLLAIGEAYYDFYQEHRNYFRILAVLHINQTEFAESDLPINQHIDSNARELLQIVADIMREGIERGEIQHTDPSLATSALWAMFDGMMIMQERSNFEFAGTNFKEVWDFGLSMFRNSLTTRT